MEGEESGTRRPWSKAVIGHAGFATWVDRFSFSLLFSRNNRFEWMEPCIPSGRIVVDFWAVDAKEEAALPSITFIDHVAHELSSLARVKRIDRYFFFFLFFEINKSLCRDVSLSCCSSRGTLNDRQKTRETCICEWEWVISLSEWLMIRTYYEHLSRFW